jgi:Domain of unknown function (DUF5658)
MLSLLWFIALQLLDATTTLAFLQHGVAEGNPLIRAVLSLATGPAAGLTIAKAAGVVLAILAWRSGRHRILSRVNVLFTGCVVWNLVAMAAA